MPWQDCVLVSQIIIGRDGSDVKTTAFQLFRFPLLGQDLSDPPCIGVQYLYNLSVVNVFFSNLEESWFSALRTPDKMLDSQFHSQPAPIVCRFSFSICIHCFNHGFLVDFRSNERAERSCSSHNASDGFTR